MYFFAQRNTTNMKTIIQKAKIVMSKKEQQVSVIQKSAKTVLLKNLFVADLKLLNQENSNDGFMFTFCTDLVKSIFQIKGNFMTNEMVLFQDNTVLANNAGVCNLLLSKITA